MDKRTKKRIDVLRQRLQKLQQQLAGAKKQCDDPAEVVELERQLNEARSELNALFKVAS